MTQKNYMKKKDLEFEINAFLEYFDCEKMYNFLKDMIPIFELYDVDDETDWVGKEVGEENKQSVRLIRTVYLMSKIADNHTGSLAYVKCAFPNLWKRMEKILDE